MAKGETLPLPTAAAIPGGHAAFAAALTRMTLADQVLLLEERAPGQPRGGGLRRLQHDR